LHKHGRDESKAAAITELSDLEFRLPRLGESAIEAARKVEDLFSRTTKICAGDQAILKAARRAIDGKAPFHKPKNSMNDSILIEIYSEVCSQKPNAGIRFAFVTHNFQDFGRGGGDNRMPHPDIESLFSKRKSIYSSNLAELLHKIAPDLVTGSMVDEEWLSEPRSLSEMSTAIDELTDQVWYDRHCLLRTFVESGEWQVVDMDDLDRSSDKPRKVQRDVWQGALAAAYDVEQRLGETKLGPWSDFEWGMINGKLSALRWALGEQWDMLDT
jgi:hypothetical protein